MGNNLSANTLFHFTGNITNLQNILKQGFKVQFSQESFDSLLEPINNEKQEVLLPMICFCDIPLSNIKEHTLKYGNYGLGLAKDWGVNHGLSPVIYSHPKAETAKIISNIRKELTKLFDIEENEYSKLNQPIFKNLTDEQINLLKINNLYYLFEQNENNKELFSSVGEYIKYIKPYSGVGYSNGKKIDEIIFYNEKEWRYVPSRENLFSNGQKDSYSVKIDRFEARRRAINMNIGKTLKLQFEPNEIKYLIVKSEDDIPIMIEYLRSIFNNSEEQIELMKLFSKIISIEQIESDF